ncbi:MAG: Rrf2 family transcriptional regulator [Clostridiales bacterium]|nr:Rrf2 family transcriptional regulator [Clostridiales bacterium]MDO4351307.1 Rrf2 family transcriptional regulator [Eubacteriales bacterium]MDY4009944.1 Rrf2 family transcriptional regulator [Candidatus Limiplasma sp.]
MKISTRGRYALRMLVDLGQHQADGPVTLKEIAQRQGISKKYLEQIAPLLVRSDILLGSRGYQGGYRLAGPLHAYRVGDILRVTEGSLAPVTCLEQRPNQCPRCGKCKTLPLWQGLDGVISRYLDSVTLEDLVNDRIEGGEKTCDPL